MDTVTITEVDGNVWPDERINIAVLSPPELAPIFILSIAQLSALDPECCTCLKLKLVDSVCAPIGIVSDIEVKLGYDVVKYVLIIIQFDPPSMEYSKTTSSPDSALLPQGEPLWLIKISKFMFPPPETLISVVVALLIPVPLK